MLACESNTVAESLIQDLQNFAAGLMHDELSWIDVQEHAVKILSSKSNSVFLASDELMSKNDMVDEAKQSGHEIITIPDSLRNKIRGQKDNKGEPIRDLGQFVKEYQDSFEFKFVDPEELNDHEKYIFNLKEQIFSLIGGKPSMVEDVKISETMRVDLVSDTATSGVWQPSSRTIIVKREKLTSIESFASTLLHEIGHAKSNAPDVDRRFEEELTSLLGKITKGAISK